MTKEAAISIGKSYEFQTGRVLGNLKNVSYDDKKKSWVLFFEVGKTSMEDDDFSELFNTGDGIFIIVDDLSGEVTEYATW